MLLAGIAVNALAGAGLGLLSFLANDEQLRSLQFWLLGSLGGARWSAVALVVGPHGGGGLYRPSAQAPAECDGAG